METATQTLTTFAIDTYIPTQAEAFLIDRKAGNASPGTLKFYQAKLSNFLAFCDSQAITQIEQLTPRIIREYLLYLETSGHNPGGIHAFYRSLRTFLRWWENEYEPEGWKNPISKVKPPRVAIEPLEPAPLEVITALLNTCRGKSYAECRDKAIILTLLDTGLRASELINLDLVDLDPTRGDLVVSCGKGRKPRTVFIGKKTRKAVRQYLAARTAHPGAALFSTQAGECLSYEGLRGIILRRSRLANVETPSLHSFRRAFALEYLRAGGYVYTLQRLLGHADLQVLRRYLAQNTTDLARGHAQFGPCDRL